MKLKENKKFTEIAMEILEHFNADKKILDEVKLQGKPHLILTDIHDASKIVNGGFDSKIFDKLKEFENSEGVGCFYINVEFPFVNFMLVAEEDMNGSMYKSVLKNNIVFSYVMNLDREEYSSYGDCVYECKDGLIIRTN